MHYDTNSSWKAAKDFLEFAATLPPKYQRAIVERLEKVSTNNAVNEPGVYLRDGNYRYYADVFSATFGDTNGDGKKDEVIEAELKARRGCMCAQCATGNTRIHDLLKE